MDKALIIGMILGALGFVLGLLMPRSVMPFFVMMDMLVYGAMFGVVCLLLYIIFYQP